MTSCLIVYNAFGLWYLIVYRFVLITNIDRWGLDYISLHAILMKTFLELWRFFFFIFFTSWKTPNERHHISMLVISYTDNAFEHVNISTLFWWRVICFLWEKLLTHTWIKKINWHISFHGNKIWLFIYTWLQVCIILNDMHLYWCIFVLLIFITETMTYFSKCYIDETQRVIFDFVILLLLIFENGFHTKTT